MALLKKIFSRDGVTHKKTILVTAPLKLYHFIRVRNYARRFTANLSSHNSDYRYHKKSAARNGDSPLRYA